MKTSMKEMAMAQNCMVSYHLGKFELSSEKGQSYHRAVIAKKIIKEFLALPVSDRESFISTVLATMVEELIPEGMFQQLTVELEKEEMKEQLKMYLTWLTETNAVLAQNGTKRDLKVEGSNTLIEVSCDYFLKLDDEIVAVSLKTGKPHLSQAGRKKETNIDTSFELYLLQQLCCEVFPEEKCKGAFHHLKARGTKEWTEYSSSFISESHPDMQISPQKEIICREAVILMDEMSSGKLTCNPSSCMNCRFKAICQYEKKEQPVLENIIAAKKAEDAFNLTSAQREAVLFDKGVVRVNAGAGSGKTTVVVLRVVEQILNGINPDEILLITFTNKGAGEIREKLRYWLEKEGLGDISDDIHIETFNSWGGKIIKNHFAEMGFTAPPRLIDKVEKYDIIFGLLDAAPRMENFTYKAPLLNFPNAKGVVVMVSQLFDYIKAQGTHNLALKYPHHNVELIKLYNQFNDILQKENLMEYQDQIKLINGCIDNADQFLDMYNYTHVIVDEFQDSDAGQMDLILHLCNQSRFKSLMIVGDDSQSIYGFRNTSQENILNFGDFFSELEDIRLMDNFRSVPEIIDLANHLNASNSKKIRKNLKPVIKSDGMRPELNWFRKKDASEDEVKFITESIEQDITIGYEPQDIAVIARTRNELFEVQKQLMERNIPYKIDVPEPLSNNPLLLPLQSLLSSIDNPENTYGIAAYVNILNGPILERKKEEVAAEINSLKDELQMIFEIDGEDGELKKEKLYSMMEIIQDAEIELFLKELKEKGLRFGEIKSFVDKFVEYEDARVYTSPSETPVKAVTLITVHASKGKEYKVVYLTLSKFKYGATSEERDEERRTAFVGITRARQKLVMSIASPPSSKTSKSGKPLAHEIQESNLVKVYEH